MRGRTMHVIPYFMGLKTVLQSQRRCPHGGMHFHLHPNWSRCRWRAVADSIYVVVSMGFMTRMG